MVGAKEAYENMRKVYKEGGKSVKTDGILEDLLSEKSYDIHKLVKTEKPADDIEDIHIKSFKMSEKSSN